MSDLGRAALVEQTSRATSSGLGRRVTHGTAFGLLRGPARSSCGTEPRTPSAPRLRRGSTRYFDGEICRRREKLRVPARCREAPGSLPRLRAAPGGTAVLEHRRPVMRRGDRTTICRPPPGEHGLKPSSLRGPDSESHGIERPHCRATSIQKELPSVSRRPRSPSHLLHRTRAFTRARCVCLLRSPASTTLLTTRSSSGPRSPSARYECVSPFDERLRAGPFPGWPVADQCRPAFLSVTRACGQDAQPSTKHPSVTRAWRTVRRHRLRARQRFREGRAGAFAPLAAAYAARGTRAFAPSPTTRVESAKPPREG